MQMDFPNVNGDSLGVVQTPDVNSKNTAGAEHRRIDAMLDSSMFGRRRPCLSGFV